MRGVSRGVECQIQRLAPIKKDTQKRVPLFIDITPFSQLECVTNGLEVGFE